MWRPPQRGHRNSYVTPSKPNGTDIILLAAFDGVGAPHHIIQQLFGTPLLSISWEIDRACCKVMNARTPWVVQRGDITRKRTPSRWSTSLAGGSSSYGRRLPLARTSLASQTVNRPRLWWTSVDWSTNPNDPHDNGPLQWTKHGKWQRLRLETERKAASEFQLDGLSFPDEVASGRLSMPTATTPGTPAPKSAPLTTRRWTAWTTEPGIVLGNGWHASQCLGPPPKQRQTSPQTPIRQCWNPPYKPYWWYAFDGDMT